MATFLLLQLGWRDGVVVDEICDIILTDDSAAEQRTVRAGISGFAWWWEWDFAPALRLSFQSTGWSKTSGYKTVSSPTNTWEQPFDCLDVRPPLNKSPRRRQQIKLRTSRSGGTPAHDGLRLEGTIHHSSKCLPPRLSNNAIPSLNAKKAKQSSRSLVSQVSQNISTLSTSRTMGGHLQLPSRFERVCFLHFAAVSYLWNALRGKSRRLSRAKMRAPTI